MSQGIRLKWGVRTMLSLVLLEALVSTHICYLKKEIRKCGADSPVCLLQPTASAIVLVMFENFTATDRWTKKPVHCIYQALIVAISTRHADADTPARRHARDAGAWPTLDGRNPPARTCIGPDATDR